MELVVGTAGGNGGAAKGYGPVNGKVNWVTSGRGGNGTSYSGGAGGASADANGGISYAITISPQLDYGIPEEWYWKKTGDVGSMKTNTWGGGLLVVYALQIIGIGKFDSVGQGFGWTTIVSGYEQASTCGGGGSVNLFSEKEIQISQTQCDVQSYAGSSIKVLGGKGTATVRKYRNRNICKELVI